MSDATQPLTIWTRPRLWSLMLAGPALLLPLFLATWLVTPPVALTFGQGLALLATVVAAVTDFKWGKIYNWCTYPACLWGLVLAAAGSAHVALGQRLGTLALSECLSGLIGCLVLMLVLHTLTGGGMGDVKLSAALGSLIGLATGATALVLSFAAAGVVVVVLSVVRDGLVMTARAYVKVIAGMLLPPPWRPELRPEERTLMLRKVRLGPFFVIGTALAILDGGHASIVLAPVLVGF